MKADADALKTVLTVIATHVSEMQVRPMEDGWHIAAMSADKTSVIDAHIPSSAFEGYEAGAPFRMDVKDMLDPVKGSKDIVEMEIGSGLARFRSGGLSFRRRLTADVGQDVRIPDLPEPGAEAMVRADELKRLVSAAGDPKDRVLRMSVKDGMLTMDASDDGGEVWETLELGADRCVMVGGEGKAAYSMAKWAEFLRAVPNGAVMTVGFSTDYPMKAEYRTEGRFDVSYILAPRIEQE